MVRRAIFLTEEGRQGLAEELDRFVSVRRREVAARIHKASETDGTVDNAEYDEARNEQAFLEGRISDLDNILSNAVVAPPEKGGGVQLGSTVHGDGRERLETGLPGGRFGRSRPARRQDIPRVPGRHGPDGP